MKENIWVEKDGFLVFRDGSIFRLNWYNTGKCVEVKQTKRNDGYLQFGCNGKMVKSHRFIASCFIPNPQNLPCINHKDENKTNNCVENLEWCTHEYNNNYGLHNKKVGKSLKNHPKLSKTVLQFTKGGKFVKEWCSAMEIQRVLGFDNSTISKCCRGVEKSSYGFLWRYK